MEQILELIISSFSARAEITRIGDVIWDHMHFHNVECTDEYNDLTISKFLALFKVRYLNNLGIINENTAKSLENLLSLKNKLDTKLGELLRTRVELGHLPSSPHAPHRRTRAKVLPSPPEHRAVDAAKKHRTPPIAPRQAFCL